MGRWIAVAYDTQFYVGQINSISEDGAQVNFLTKRKDSCYKWPRPKDMAVVSAKYIFCSNPRVQKVGTTFVISNENHIRLLYDNYKKTYMTS